MRVFVLCTGRCGSMSLYEACKHINNYTAGHEEKNNSLEYPDQHIAISPQFRVRAGELFQKYPEDYYVWLWRDPEKVAASYAQLGRGGWLDRYWVFYNRLRPESTQQAAETAVGHMLSMIARVWLDIPVYQKQELQIERIAGQFAPFWERIGAKGDRKAALDSLKTPRNTMAERRGK